MDGDQFDAALRALTTARRTLFGASLASILGAHTPEIAAKKKKHKRKHKKKTCTSSQKTCGTSCIPLSDCCTDADCGQLGAGGTCSSGRCSCPTDYEHCLGTCAPVGTCCTTDAECGGNFRHCVDGICGPSPFCLGHDSCQEDFVSCESTGVDCYCWIVVGAPQSLTPFCGRPAEAKPCNQCTADETCVDLSGAACVGGRTGCSLPCPSPR